MYACVLIGLVACTEHDSLPDKPEGGAVMVSFSTGVASESDTRAYTGRIDDVDALMKVSDGFGVFAYLTETQTWDAATSGKAVGDADYPLPDFMYNQSVYWGTQYVKGVEQNDWVYSPPKYWPNTSNNAEDYRYISFYAYAPFVSLAELEAQSTCITAMPGTTDKAPHVVYTMRDGTELLDLLYASCPNAKRTGTGLIEVSTSGEPPVTTQTYQRVPLTFKHALSRVDFYVQRLYNEETFTGQKPDAENHTKIFVSKLELEETSATPKAIYSKGRLDLASGTWSDLTGKTGVVDDDKKMSYAEETFSNAIGGMAFAAEGATPLQLITIRNTELDKWGKDGFGVDDQERPLFTGSSSLFFIPQTMTITPTLTFSLVTRDDELALNDLADSEDHKYVRILNRVEGDPVTLNLEKGKRYKVLVHVGVETVHFEVVGVDDWDFPIRVTPEIDPYKQDPKEKTLNES